MLRLIKYLKPYSWLMLLISGLLFGQAMAELALPDFMSRIVNIGIQQSGIQDTAPVVIRAGEMKKVRLFMNETDIDFMNKYYVLTRKLYAEIISGATNASSNPDPVIFAVSEGYIPLFPDG